MTAGLRTTTTLTATDFTSLGHDVGSSASTASPAPRRPPSNRLDRPDDTAPLSIALVIEFGLILAFAIWLVVATLNVAANFETPLTLFVITVVVTAVTIGDRNAART